jgi:hypothetical protein
MLRAALLATLLCQEGQGLMGSAAFPLHAGQLSLKLAVSFKMVHLSDSLLRANLFAFTEDP